MEVNNLLPFVRKTQIKYVGYFLFEKEYLRNESV